MLTIKSLICAALTLATAKSSTEVTFKNILVQAYDGTYKYKYGYPSPILPVKQVESARTLNDYFPENSHFTRVLITNGSIPILYENSISDVNLLGLDLTNDNITVIQPGTFKNSSIQQLVITQNKIERIEEGVFNNLNVSILDLKRNSIKSIAGGAFNNMRELLIIYLESNLLAVWNKDWFTNTPYLSGIYLRNNLLEEIPALAFQNIKGDKHPGWVTSTITIDLSQNKIKTIDKTAFTPSKISILDLSENQIADWNPEVLSNVTVKFLRLPKNKIQCLSGDLSKTFAGGLTYIGGNPWNCECLKNIDLWATKNRIYVAFGDAKANCNFN